MALMATALLDRHWIGKLVVWKTGRGIETVNYFDGSMRFHCGVCRSVGSGVARRATTLSLPLPFGFLRPYDAGYTFAFFPQLRIEVQKNQLCVVNHREPCVAHSCCFGDDEARPTATNGGERPIEEPPIPSGEPRESVEATTDSGLMRPPLEASLLPLSVTPGSEGGNAMNDSLLGADSAAGVAANDMDMAALLDTGLTISPMGRRGIGDGGEALASPSPGPCCLLPRGVEAGSDNKGTVNNAAAAEFLAIGGARRRTLCRSDSRVAFRNAFAFA